MRVGSPLKLGLGICMQATRPDCFPGFTYDVGHSSDATLLLTPRECCTFFGPRLRCRLGLVMSAYTWTPEDCSLAPEGCVGSLGHRLVDRELGRSSHVGISFWSLVELQPLGVCCDVPGGQARSSLGSLSGLRYVILRGITHRGTYEGSHCGGVLAFGLKLKSMRLAEKTSRYDRPGLETDGAGRDLRSAWTGTERTSRYDWRRLEADMDWHVCSRKMALASFKMGNKQAAFRCIRQSKLLSERRSNYTSLLDRVEEVLSNIANAESTMKVTYTRNVIDNISCHIVLGVSTTHASWTMSSVCLKYQVSEAIQIGNRAMKEYKISVDEVKDHLEELDKHVRAQKEVDEALESMPLGASDVEEEDVEEEFKKLELELSGETDHPELQEPVAPDVTAATSPQASTETLSQTLSKLNLEAA
ncbi:hypothetical protein B296_00046420 [Ensete ventricosum]|uniref:Uncharacterized protein n=1 Tax=Ensete ventricosum TaxID=4639 RepID=A0A426Y460_ENSVE|nr:hypothetical protein B296_00046420 [Ensete ventricosum]